ncbi:MAG: glycosyltransferase family 4 protein [Clostridia bacterium]|nr:glycosyltransferase family 4 protein [Clostridia bacterium]
MYKVGICGHFAIGHELVNGQIDKTKSVYKALAKALGEEQITILDTRGWKKNPLKLFLNCKKMLDECENIIMLPAHGGVRIFPLLFDKLNSKKRKLHYIVIGGWLPELLKNDAKLLKQIKRLDRVYVELECMRTALLDLGVENAVYMPNFKETNALRNSELILSQKLPLRLCTFSRIMEEKGIERAIEAVRTINREHGKTVFELDIFGTPEPKYKERFEIICKGFEPYIKYKGFINTDSSTQTLKDYFAVLFPTKYHGEGFPGTIVSAFAAGVPVIATDWRYNATIIRNGIDGMVYDPHKPELLAKILVEAAKKPELFNNMKPACLERAAHFDADTAVKTLLKELESEKEVHI